jgi:DNA-binding CsgD family transcriptional regulator
MKNQILRFLSLSFICMSGFFSVLHANTSWNNFIINYDKNLYGKGSQTWQTVPFNSRWVYFANKNGLIEFNGISWNLFPLNNGSDVRSVYPSKKHQRIYVGGINEFGFFEPNEKGKLIYTCLSDLLRKRDLQIGNIWKIYEIDNIIFFQGDTKIVKYSEGKIASFDAHRKIDCSDLINGIIYVGTNEGVFILAGNIFLPLKGAELFNSKRIRGFLPYKNGVLIVTAYDGLYFFDGNSVHLFKTGVEPFMQRNEVFCAASSGNMIALGTVHKGILLIDLQRQTVKYFNENNGLRNNTVLSLGFDKENNLWAGLDNGIDYICLNSPFTNLYSYPYSFGTGYTALLSDKYLYLGTNRGLYCTKFPVVMGENQPDILPVEASSGQVWNLAKAGDDLFCFHDRGIFLVKGSTLTKIGNIIGAWNCKPVIGSDNKIIVGSYDGLYLLEKNGARWTIVRKIEGFYDSCRYFELESANVIWVFNTEKTMRLTLDPDLTRVVNIKRYGADKGFPTDNSNYVSKVNNKIYFATEKGIYEYYSPSDSMIPSKKMNDILNGEKPYLRLIPNKNQLIGFNHKEICIADLNRKRAPNNPQIIPIEFQAMELVFGAENIVPISDSALVIPNEYGFALLNLPDSKDKPSFEHYSLRINKVFISHPKDSLIFLDNFLDRKITPKIAFSHNSIRIEYGVTSFNQRKDFNYLYRLNKEPWSDATHSQTKEYSKLHEGDYKFQVRVILENGKTISDEFSFVVLPPWYRSKTAYFIYFLLLLAAIFYLYKWDDARIKRKKLQVALEKDMQMKNLEEEFEAENKRKERQIMQLEKEKLEHDLQHKSQEMANLMINLVRKNEILNEIKSDLYRIMSSLKNDHSKEVKQMILLTNNKIDSNIQSDEVLKRIEEQFDLIHNNFMKRLQEKHPDLSLNERMMCAYLKMNLTTKEIAPLLNISIRGVETLRYRLRKKFNLNRDENLIDYLNNKI